MANNQLYTTAAVLLNQNLLGEAMGVTAKFNGALQTAKTLAKGRAGVSKGAVVNTFTIDSEIPFSGFEVDVISMMNNVEEVELTLFMASSTLTVKGNIMSVDVSKSVDANAKHSFTFECGECIFE